MSVARMAHASAQRSIQSHCGPPSSDYARANSRAESWNLQTERQTLHNTEQERLLGDSAGVGAVVTSSLPDAAAPIAIASAQSMLNIDATLRKQLLRPSSKMKQATQNSAPKLNGRNSGLETRRQEDEISSEDDQGRSGLGRSMNPVRNERSTRQPKKKKAKTEVETFESIQNKGNDLEKDENFQDEEEVESDARIPPAKIPARPKSYLDEALEARRMKQQRKKIKKEKEKSKQQISQ